MISNHTGLRELLSLFDVGADQLGGIELWRLGDLARTHGVTRWKRAPAGTGSNVDIVRLSLNANGLALYSHDAVALTFSNGNLMTDAVLKELHADDHVVVLDLDYDIARSVAEVSLSSASPDLSEELVESYRGDRIRAANHADVDRIIESLILPSFTSGRPS